MSYPGEDNLGPEERYLLERYGDNVVGLLKYGSMAFGQPHSRSVHDFWIIVRDLHAFHKANEEFYRHGLNHSSTVEEQVEANRFAPNFYSFQEDGVLIKAAVISESDFARLCRSKMMFVKGRMQKPVRVIRSTPLIDSAIAAARVEGVRHAVNLCRKRFSMDEFLYQLCSLSYRAEIRPERKHAKIRSIMDGGGERFRSIYRRLLPELPHVREMGNGYEDTRPPAEKAEARKKTLGYIRRCKWSTETLKLIWRNYRTHGSPIKYIWDKLAGEVEKGLHRRRTRRANARAR